MPLLRMRAASITADPENDPDIYDNASVTVLFLHCCVRTLTIMLTDCKPNYYLLIMRT